MTGLLVGAGVVLAVILLGLLALVIALHKTPEDWMPGRLKEALGEDESGSEDESE